MTLVAAPPPPASTSKRARGLPDSALLPLERAFLPGGSTEAAWHAANAVARDWARRSQARANHDLIDDFAAEAATSVVMIGHAGTFRAMRRRSLSVYMGKLLTGHWADITRRECRHRDGRVDLPSDPEAIEAWPTPADLAGFARERGGDGPDRLTLLRSDLDAVVRHARARLDRYLITRPHRDALLYPVLVAALDDAFRPFEDAPWRKRAVLGLVVHEVRDAIRRVAGDVM